MKMLSLGYRTNQLFKHVFRNEITCIKGYDLAFTELLKNEIVLNDIKEKSVVANYIVLDLINDGLKILRESLEPKQSLENLMDSCTTFDEDEFEFLRKIIINECYITEDILAKENIEANEKDLKRLNEYLQLMYRYLSDTLHVPMLNEIKTNDHSQIDNQLYTKLYNTLDLTQEYYKIPFSYNTKLIATASVNVGFVAGGEIEIEKFTDGNKTILFLSDYYDDVFKSSRKVLPVLKQSAEYIVDTKVERNELKIELIVNFFNKEGKMFKQVVINNNNHVIHTPESFSFYRIYLRANGIGKTHINYISIRRNRSIGYVTAHDQVRLFQDSEPVKYIYQKNKSEYLVVAFHGFNPHNTKYEFLDVLKNYKVNKLFILDDYGLNGTFYQDQNRKDNLQRNIISLIKEIANENNIDMKNIIMLGRSEGAGSALYYGLRMNAGHILAGGPPIFWGIFNTDYYHHISFMKNVAGSLTEKDTYYMDNIVSRQVHKNIVSKIEFLSITNDKYYESHFEKFAKLLDQNNITYSNDLKIGKGHSDLPKHLDSWVREKLDMILQTDISKETKKVMKFGVIGSCDSRDLFRIKEEYEGHSSYSVEEYIARSSIVSMMAEKSKKTFGPDDILLESAFRKKSLMRDLNKTAYSELEELAKKVDFIVIDFMEERFDLLEYNDTFFTRSWEYRESNIAKELEVNILNRNDEKVRGIWEESCLRFISELKKHFLPSQIILNEVKMVERYFEKGKYYYFKNIEEIREFNEVIKHYNEFFKNHFEGIQVIKPTDNELYYCDSNHLWGKFPYHFNDLYYLNAINQIKI